MLSWFRRDRPASELPPQTNPPAEPRVPTSTVDATVSETLRRSGNSLLQQGQAEQAMQAFRRAVELDPGNLGARINLGFVLNGREEFAEAKAVLQQAVELDPTNDDALYLLGTAELALDDEAAAMTSFRRALAVRPDFEPCRRDLCLILVRRGEHDAARRQAALGIEADPRAVELHTIMGDLHRQAGELDQAVASFRTAQLLLPTAAHVHASLGEALQERGNLPEALACYQRALQLDPKLAVAMLNMGLLLHRQGDLTEAVKIYRDALAVAPDHIEVLSNLGSALTGLQRLPEACEVLNKAIRLAPDHVGAHINLGIALWERSELDAALTSYRRALALRPDHAAAHGNLATVLQALGEHDAAIASYRSALSIEPDFADAQNNLLFTLNYQPDKSAQEIFADYREYDERVGVPLRSTWRKHSNSRDATKRLKVGYVSPDFRKHSVRHFLEPLLAHHEKRLVEVFAYAELSVEDELTARYRSLVDQWVPTIGLSDEALAERIRADGIDILVDLAGHTAKNRLRVFARKPAPVSISWLGFGYTTGLSAIDYFLTDGVNAPEGSEDLFAEQPWRVATPVCAYRPAEGMGHVSSLPAQDRGFVTFGTLTRAVRINHRSIRVWSQMLHRVPGSRLVVDSMNYRDARVCTTLLDKFSAHGIGPERLQIGFHSPPWDVLRGMDIGLDCFPHNSGTTLFETLFMGVPYVTLAGRPSVGRLGSSILHGAGHPEWIAHSEDEYVDIAVALAGDLPKLAQLRAGLRAQMQASALMDEPGFARKVEAAYRQMFSRWAAGPGQP
jgi:protein O-GlcNAc transferase